MPRRKKKSNWRWPAWDAKNRWSVPAEAKTEESMVRFEPETKHGSFERRQEHW
jgi:hypothetical protein